MSSLWRTAAQAATIGIFVMLFIAALDLARPILLPAVSAFVVTMMLGPLSARADRFGVPPLLTAIALWLLVTLVFYGRDRVAVGAGGASGSARRPTSAATSRKSFACSNGRSAALREMRNALLPSEAGKGLASTSCRCVQPAVGIVTPAIGQVFIFFGTLFFMLLGRSRMRHVMVAFFHNREARLRTLRIMNDIEHNLTGYLSVVAVINIVVGLGAGVIAWAVGLPDPLAWGVLGFVLNFIPYIGALIMEIGMFMVGLVTFPR